MCHFVAAQKNWLEAPHSLLERDLLPSLFCASFGERSHVRMSCRPDPLLVYAHRLKVPHTQSLRRLFGVWKIPFWGCYPPLSSRLFRIFNTCRLLFFYQKKFLIELKHFSKHFRANTKKHFVIVFPPMFEFLSPFSESQFMFERGRDWSERNKRKILSTILFCTRDRSRRERGEQTSFFDRKKGEVKNWETETMKKKRFLLLYR